MPEPEHSTVEIPMLPDSEAIERVRSAIEARDPFSMIRLNDGEAVALAFGDDLSLKDLSYLHSHWGADGVTLGDVARVRDDLRTAVERADLIGTRTDIMGVPIPVDLLERSDSEVQRFVADTVPLRPQERAALSVASARRIALLQRLLTTIEVRPDQEWCSCWLHWEMLASGMLNEIMGSVDEIGLVTPRLELEHLIERRFGIRVSTVPVPDKFVEAHQSGAHVPRRYRTIRDDLDFRAGTTVLVGAGIPGKVYCDWLKERGCVALDIGAVFDAWAGKASRPRVLESRFAVRGGGTVPAELQLREQRAADDHVLVPRWKPTKVAP